MAEGLAHPPERNPPEVETAFEASPPEVIAEIIDGALRLRRLPALRHGRASSRLAQALGAFDEEGGGWVLLPRVDVYLGPRPDRLVPDLAGWGRERLPELPNEAGIIVAPDWVCELLSPDTERSVRASKMRIYRREGVRHVWLLNPATQMLEVYRHGSGGWSLLETYEGDARVRAEPFDAVELDLARLWA